MDRPRMSNWYNDPQLMVILTNTTNICNHLKDFFEVDEASVSDPSLLWAAHKAYIVVPIKISLKSKCQRTQQLNELLDTI